MTAETIFRILPAVTDRRYRQNLNEKFLPP